MFKNILKELDLLTTTTSISVPIEADADGYYDKECPAKSCLFNFKVLGEDWTNIVSEEEVFCPACRHSAPAKSWYTRDQIERAKNYAVKQIQRGINRAMREDATDWNRRQPHNAFLKLTMDVKGVSTPVLMPIAAAEVMRRRSTCEKCGCRYSFIGAAFFCPSCGANSARHTFQQTLATIRTAPRMSEIVRKSLDPDQAAELTRLLLEKSFQDTVMSFQRLAEQLYGEIPNAPATRHNVFQNVDGGSELWAKALNHGYDDVLSSDEMRRLRIYFQQRHLLAHRHGIVDDDYVARSGDTAYVVGQRLVLGESDVLDFANIVERLGTALIELSSGGKITTQK